MAKSQDYAWVTTELFDDVLAEVIGRALIGDEHASEYLQQVGAAVLAIPGAYEVMSEHFNNAVLERIDELFPLKETEEDEEGEFA